MADVIIYTRQGCGYCSAAKRLLSAKGVTFREIDCTGNATLRSEMMEKSGRNTFPQVFIGGTHVGGCDDLHALDHSGKLDGLLAA
ncbi:glutaredoxin 3 [Pseudoxanthobacter sp.]|uniref:glutaredoxin 3 n=1 Tax=Pseudoxanthobacter sp. TaxID=1925742 RepID=UPI002FE14892